MIEHERVSVIVPIYNAEKFLLQCVQSVQKQTWDNVEIILVNDGSEDGSGLLCDQLAMEDARIRVIHQKNRGVSAARNSGIQFSTGEYLMFVDSDDELHLEAVERLMADMEQFCADIVSAVKCNVLPDGAVVNPYENGEQTLYTGIDSITLALNGDRQTNSSCAKLFRRSFLGDTRFVEGRHIHEDGFFVFQCYAKRPRLLQHNVCVYKYYMRENSASRQPFSEKYLDMLYFCQQKKDIVNACFPELRAKIPNMEMRTHLLFLQILCRTYDRKYRDYTRQSIRTIRRVFHDADRFVQSRQERRMAMIVYFRLYHVYKAWIYLRRYRNR